MERHRRSAACTQAAGPDQQNGASLRAEAGGRKRTRNFPLVPRGQGRDRTAALSLFRRTLMPAELPDLVLRRDGAVRTRDLLDPDQARCQAALRPGRRLIRGDPHRCVPAQPLKPSVWMTGFEPVTSSIRTRHAAKLRYIQLTLMWFFSGGSPPLAASRVRAQDR